MFIQNNKRKKTRNILLGTIGFMVLVLMACIAGYSYSRAQLSKKVDEDKAAETEYPTINIPVSTSTPKPTQLENEDLYDAAMAAEQPNGDELAEGARLNLAYEYYLCGHTHSATITDGVSGKTSEELEMDYRGDVLEFTPSHAMVKISYNMYCPEHFILISVDGKLQILQTVLGQDEMTVYREIEGITMPPDDELEKGIVFDSLEAIELYLENIES